MIGVLPLDDRPLAAIDDLARSDEVRSNDPALDEDVRERRVEVIHAIVDERVAERNSTVEPSDNKGGAGTAANRVAAHDARIRETPDLDRHTRIAENRFGWRCHGDDIVFDDGV